MVPTPSNSSCILLLVRHGATENNLADPPILQGRCVDCGLSEQGVAQAKSVATALTDVRIDGIFSSPLRRALETATSIAGPRSSPIVQVDALTEVDVGDWETRSWIHIEKEDPDLYQDFMQDPSTFGYKNGENLTNVFDRVSPAMQSLLDSHLGKTIVVVAHNVVNRVFLAHAMGLGIKNAREISQDNCGINIIKHQNGATKVKSLNSTFHLP